MDTEPTEEPAPDPGKLREDPKAFREAHSRYGSYLKEGGLPFEPEEFEDEDGGSPGEDGGSPGEDGGSPAKDADGSGSNAPGS